MSDAATKLRAGRPAEIVVPICTRGDLVAEFGRLDAQLRQQIARQAADSRIAGTSTETATRLQDLEVEIVDSTVEFRIRALPRKRWQQLVEEHPPRVADDGSVHDDDADLRLNVETFFPAAIRACTVEPELGDDDWQALLDPDGDLLNDEQYHRLANAAWSMNRRDVSVPFSLAASLTMRHSEAGSVSPASSE